MNKEIQDLAWACLPKEARNYAKRIYQYECEAKDYNDGANDALESLFGKHNLTSDTEPEEMLMVSRKSVQNMYKNTIKRKESATNDVMIAWTDGCLDAFLNIFGDKCLPDKIQDTGFGGMNLTPPACKLDVKPEQPSVQGEPRFKVGDKVRIIKQNHSLYGKTAIVDVPMKDAPEILVNRMGNLYSFYESELEPYTEPETTDNMEEKELNLAELLKGCEGTILYSRAYGDVSLNEIVRDDRPNAQEIKVYTPDPQSDRIWFLRNGRKHKNGEIDLWPSRALYEKYPLDPYSAWMEWKAQRELEFNKPECYITDVNKWWELKVVAKFHSSKEAKQAAEAVRETLMKFHEQNQK